MFTYVLRKGKERCDVFTYVLHKEKERCDVFTCVLQKEKERWDVWENVVLTSPVMSPLTNKTTSAVVTFTILKETQLAPTLPSLSICNILNRIIIRIPTLIQSSEMHFPFLP